MLGSYTVVGVVVVVLDLVDTVRRDEEVLCDGDGISEATVFVVVMVVAAVVFLLVVADVLVATVVLVVVVCGLVTVLDVVVLSAAVVTVVDDLAVETDFTVVVVSREGDDSSVVVVASVVVASDAVVVVTEGVFCGVQPSGTANRASRATIVKTGRFIGTAPFLNTRLPYHKTVLFDKKNLLYSRQNRGDFRQLLSQIGFGRRRKRITEFMKMQISCDLGHR